MTIVFMSLMAAVIAEGIGPHSGLAALVPLLLLGVGSVWWWAFGGDLRLYVFVQYYPLIGIPLILLLFPGAAVRRGWRPLLLAFLWYGIAKIAEATDCRVYTATPIVSGHTLKHLAAGWSTWLLVKRFKLMYRQ